MPNPAFGLRFVKGEKLMPVSGLCGRRVHIAGSAAESTQTKLLRYGHSIVAKLVRRILEQGAGLVLGVGKEPRRIGEPPENPALIFDWTIVETAAQCLREGRCSWPAASGPAMVIVISEKAESEIPEDRRELWEEVIGSGQLKLELIMPGARSGALIRERQAQFGDVLLTLGGGTGVEHLADLYLNRHQHVLPLDLPLGASRQDGTGGSERLAREARMKPGIFFRLQTEFVGQENARLATTATRGASASPEQVVDGLVELMTALELPKAFYVRLMNRRHRLYSQVEAFFRRVVDPVVSDAGLERVDMGTDILQEAFLNLAIFRSLHFASVVIVDVTGERPNCFIELGYALGHEARVIVTARDGANLPFDQQAIPCHFWKADADDTLRQLELAEFWRRNVNRNPIIS